MLRAFGLGGAAIVVGAPLLEEKAWAAGPQLVRQPAIAGAPPAEQLHVQFGAEAAREVVVSWATATRVSKPQLRLGDTHGLGHNVDAIERVYTDALTGETVFTYHAPLLGLTPDTEYSYQVLHKGADPVSGRFKTGPLARSRNFRFTSFGDQAIPAAVGTGLGPHTPNAGYIVDAVEAMDPLFHLMNGDLCYANVSDAPVATWSSFFNNNMRSARNRPWMPCAGNHENEVGNGPQGYLAYQTRHYLPDNGEALDFKGNWYAFTVGNVRVVSINNDDVCLQDGAFSAYRRDHIATYGSAHLDPYIHGYSHGEQKTWLEETLRGARLAPGVDWVIVCMHQVAMSSAHFNGADLGIRQEFGPLFDTYVDLIVCGHEHHFERTFPVRGTTGNNLLTPAAKNDNANVIDTTQGWVQMIIGGGGHSSPTPVGAFDMPHDGVVIYDIGPGSPTAQHPSLTTTEPGDWSAYRDLQTPYGFAAFDVTPRADHGMTTIRVTHYGAAAGSPHYTPLDSFTLQRPRKRLADGRELSDTDH
jgi:hypothetical protein